MQCVVCQGNQFGKLFIQPNGWGVGKCLSCGLVQVVPMPSEKKISSLYHEDMEHFAPYIAQIPVHRAYFQKTLHTVISVKPGHERTLLDIGCAMGVFLEEAKKIGFLVKT